MINYDAKMKEARLLIDQGLYNQAVITLANVLDEMEPDEAADLLGDLPADQAEQVLAQMEEADDVIPLLGYPDETAGGLMTTSYIALRRQTTVEQAINFLRSSSPDIRTPYYLYVVDRSRKLIGVVGLRELVNSPPETTMESIMVGDVISVQTGTDQEEVARVMTRYDLTAVPVVDSQGVLVGVITYDDIIDVIEDEITEDVLQQGAIEQSGRGLRGLSHDAGYADHAGQCNLLSLVPDALQRS